ncbi:MAG: hypothetical protein DHS20C02_10360 [Micavibrio sp.]|nr:MAG: hypothetical protein DHS20C02_10360 [Micavibrio sp.]
MKRSCYLAALILMLFALPACETVEGMKEDISGIGMPEFASLGQDRTAITSTCPEVHIVEELATLKEFASRTDNSPGNLVSKVDINQIESSCKRGNQSITVDLKLAFAGKVGPQGRARGNDMPYFSYPFFVAITAPNGNILAKEVFAAPITYEREQDTRTYYESLRQIIPVKYETKAGKYKVLVGFQLNNDQLAYNRAQIELQKEAERKGSPLGSLFTSKNPAPVHNSVQPASGGTPSSATDDSVQIFPLDGPPNDGPIDLTSPKNN